MATIELKGLTHANPTLPMFLPLKNVSSTFLYIFYMLRTGLYKTVLWESRNCILYFPSLFPVVL